MSWTRQLHSNFRRLPRAGRIACWVVGAFVVLVLIGSVLPKQSTSAGTRPSPSVDVETPAPQFTAVRTDPPASVEASESSSVLPTPTETATVTTSAAPPPAPAAVTTLPRTPAAPPPPPPARPVHSTVVPPPAPPTSAAPAPANCHPLTNGGNCYEPGEFCRKSDHGVTGLAGDGEAIECENNDGWRWEPV